jgi:hypothetical protein
MFGSFLTKLDEVSYPNFRIAYISFSSRVLDWVIGFCKDRLKSTLQHCVCIHNNMLPTCTALPSCFERKKEGATNQSKDYLVPFPLKDDYLNSILLILIFFVFIH